MDFESNCRRCGKDAHCCIFEKCGFTFISPKNAKDIKRKINKDYGYFLDYSPLSKKVVDVLKNCDPALEGWTRYLQLDNENRILRLKIRKDGRCIFLGNGGKCRIYSIRPNICRIFPFWGMRLTNGMIKVILHDVNPKCSAVKSFAKQHEDIEKALPRSEIIAIIKIFRGIEKEADSYKKQIKAFVKEL